MPRSTRDAIPTATFFQLCFVVKDLEKAMPHFTGLFGVGPWFVSATPAPAEDNTVYRGTRTPIAARIALGYSGPLMYELVSPNPGSQSIFTERAGLHGFGIHHFGFAVEDLDDTIRTLGRAGCELLMTHTTSRGTRVAMVGGDEPLGVIEEYIEVTQSTRRFYELMHAEAERWDGHSLVYSGTAPQVADHVSSGTDSATASRNEY